MGRHSIVGPKLRNGVLSGFLATAPPKKPASRKKASAGAVWLGMDGEKVEVPLWMEEIHFALEVPSKSKDSACTVDPGFQKAWLILIRGVCRCSGDPSLLY